MKQIKTLISIFLSLISFTAIGQEITVFGTSFSYGQDVNRNEAYSVKLQEKLQANGINVKVLNFSVSGDTTLDLLGRIDRIPKDTKIVIFEYAIGNDQRAGIKREITEQNAAAVIKKLLGADKKVLLVLRGLHEDRLRDLNIRWSPFIKETGITYISIYQPPEKNAATNPAYFHPNPSFHNEIANQLLTPITQLLR